MSGVTRLLERIREMELLPEERRPVDQEKLQQSVLRHLSKLLNTRQGSSLLARDYGVPDYTSLTTAPSAKNMAIIAQSISEVVQRYEPRLANIDVNFVEDPDEPTKMMFSLSGTIAADDSRNEVIFNTVLDPTGKITLRRNAGA